jgi:hypothetical protein
MCVGDDDKWMSKGSRCDPVASTASCPPPRQRGVFHGAKGSRVLVTVGDGSWDDGKRFVRSS